MANLGSIGKGLSKLSKGADEVVDKSILDDMVGSFKPAEKPTELPKPNVGPSGAVSPKNAVPLSEDEAILAAIAKWEDAPLKEDEVLSGVIDEIDLGDTPLKEEEILDSQIFEEIDLGDTPLKEEELLDSQIFEDIDLGDTPLPGDPGDIGGPDPLDKNPLLYLIDEFLPDTTPGSLDEWIGKDMAKQIQVLHVTGAVTGSTLEGGLHALIKNAKKQPMTTYEEAVMGIITDKMELVDVEKGSLIVDEFIDLDALEITADRPNVPEGFTFEKIANDIPEWAVMRDDDEMEALTLMTHIRGGDFPNIGDELAVKNYRNAKDTSGRPTTAMYPSLEEFEAMDPMDKVAINFYTRSGDGPMNDALRQGKVDPASQLGKAIQATDDALSRLPSWNPDQGLLHRRINGQNMVDKYASMEPGDTFTETGFTSTSRGNMLAKDGEGNNIYIGGQSDIYFIIHSKEGGRAKAIEGLSDFADSEKEVLYRPGTEFKIVAKETDITSQQNFNGTITDSEHTIIYLEEI